MQSAAHSRRVSAAIRLNLECALPETKTCSNCSNSELRGPESRLSIGSWRSAGVPYVSMLAH
eukprot:9041442-Alexandrium_andersonii.AAC.1